MTAFSMIALSLSLAGLPAQDPTVEPLDLEDSIVCAGIFFAHSRQPEIEALDGVQIYEDMTVVFLERAEVLGGRVGLTPDDVIERAAAISDQFTGILGQQSTPEAREAMLEDWFDVEQVCVAGGQLPIPDA
ncbi:MAG: hypothetical protein V7672_01910 [Brevundimonas sp.]|jgi:hypothetical protein|uniref:hypothetical protein n=1 Tax=Brevundimonas sp. TaxID=1871086 RepID=UPI00300214F6